jgi:transcriptional regulator with XRE-family HTH domain
MEKQPQRETFNTDELEKLGKRLREIRKEKGYKTAEDAANKLDIQRSQYTRYESGKSNLNYLTLVEVLHKMDIPISEFFSKGFD